jgi:hypothetical protein
MGQCEALCRIIRAETRLAIPARKRTADDEDFAEGLREPFSPPPVFDEMADERWHRTMLFDMYRVVFGEYSLIRRQTSGASCITASHSLLMRPLGSTRRKFAGHME